MKISHSFAFFKHKKVRSGLLGLFAVVLCMHLYHAFIGWHFYLSGPHDFRQTQTAIATYYIVEEGPALAYKIPVQGPIWRLPFEFPTYQSITAFFKKVSGSELDQTGRAVSLAAFYIALIPLYKVLRKLSFSLEQSIAVGILLCTSATYIFWSRAFLIESTAFCLALFYTHFTFKYRDTPKLRTLVFALIFGTLAAVTKFTTFSIFFGFIVTYHLLQLFIASRTESSQSHILNKQNLFLVFTLGIPVVITLLWNNYIFSIWALSPLQEGAAESIHRWNFGSWKFRFQTDYWGRFYLHAFERTKFTFLPVLIGLIAFGLASKFYRTIALVCLIAWISGPLVWANLFYVHDYYYYATHFLLLIWFCASIFGMLDGLRLPMNIGYLIIAVLAGLQIFEYRQSNYFEAQLHNWGKDRIELAFEVGANTEENDVLFILGDDWSPVFSYYSERYSIMYRWFGYDRDGKFQEAVDLMKAEGKEFGAAIIRNEEQYIAEFDRLALRSEFKAKPESQRAQKFIYYLAKE